MNDKNTISDELLTKFLCGKTTPEETELVMAYMAESDENIEDLKNICAAVEIMHDVEKATPRRSTRRFLWIISSVAVVAAAIVICTMAFNRSNRTKDFPMIAEQTDTVNFKQQFQDTTVAIEIDIKTENASKSEHPKMTNEFVPIQPAIESKHYAGEMSKKNYVNVLYPYKDIYLISPDKQTFDFRWDSDAQNVHLTITDFDDRILIDKWLDGEEHYLWEIPSIKEKAFFWKMVFHFRNGSTKTKQGRIQNENFEIEVD